MLQQLRAFALFLPLSLWGQGTTYIDGARTIEQPINYCGSDTGTTVNVLVCGNPTSAKIRAYQVGNTYSLKSVRANTGAVTLSIDGLAGIAVKKNGGTTALIAGDLTANQIVSVQYDGVQFDLLSPPANNSSITTTANPNQVLAGPASGATGATVTPRALVPADLPLLDGSEIATGTIVSARLPYPGTNSAGIVFPQSCNSGQHINSILTTGVVTCSNDSGGLTALNPSPAGNYGSSTVVPVLTVDQYGRITTASTAVVSGGGGSSPQLSTGSGAGGRPALAAGTAGIYTDTSQSPGQQVFYWNGTAWYQLGLVTGNFTYDAAGRLDLNASNVALLGQANTFSSATQIIPNLQVGAVTCTGGGTACLQSPNQSVAVQQFGAAQGNAGTLNFGNGLNAVVSNGSANVTTTGYTGTKTVGGCVMSFVNGTVSNITGC